MGSLNGTKNANDSSVFNWSPCSCCFLCWEFYPKVKPLGKAFADVKQNKTKQNKTKQNKKLRKGRIIWDRVKSSLTIICVKLKRIMRCLKHMGWRSSDGQCGPWWDDLLFSHEKDREEGLLEKNKTENSGGKCCIIFLFMKPLKKGKAINKGPFIWDNVYCFTSLTYKSGLC